MSSVMCKTHEYSFINHEYYYSIICLFLLCINRNVEDVETGVKGTTISKFT